MQFVFPLTLHFSTCGPHFPVSADTERHSTAWYSTALHGTAQKQAEVEAVYFEDIALDWPYTRRLVCSELSCTKTTAMFVLFSRVAVVFRDGLAIQLPEVQRWCMSDGVLRTTKATKTEMQDAVEHPRLGAAVDVSAEAPHPWRRGGERCVPSAHVQCAARHIIFAITDSAQCAARSVRMCWRRSRANGNANTRWPSSGLKTRRRCNSIA